MSHESPEISYDDFANVEMRVGQITDVQEFPEARKPAYKLIIDFGDEIGIKRSSAQVTENYTPAELKGRKVLAVVNFPEKQIGPFRSQVLTLGTADENGTVLLVDPGENAILGARLY
jgi:tRNA-binding protein